MKILSVVKFEDNNVVEIEYENDDKEIKKTVVTSIDILTKNDEFIYDMLRNREIVNKNLKEYSKKEGEVISRFTNKEFSLEKKVVNNKE